MARRFFLRLNVVAVPDTANGDIVLKGINDSGGKAEIGLEVRAVDVAGGDRVLYSGKATLSPDKSAALTRIPLKKLKEGEFLFFSWRDGDGNLIGENDFFPRAYKYYDIAGATVKSSWSDEGGKPVLTLTTDKPALFVTATTKVPGYFSDNAVTLLPGRETRLSFTPRHGARVTQKALAAGLQVRHLRETY